MKSSSEAKHSALFSVHTSQRRPSFTVREKLNRNGCNQKGNKTHFVVCRHGRCPKAISRRVSIESVLRETYPIPQVDETLAQQLEQHCSVNQTQTVDFWQIPLSEESRLLTTFITPYGRYCFNKLPFGISSAPELFQRRMSVMFEGLPGELCLMDDIIMYGASREEHDARLATTPNNRSDT